MPLYEFFCPNCEWEGDDFAALDARDAKRCPDCAALLKRKIGRVHIDIPPIHQAVNHTLLDNHNRHMASPEVQAKLKSGEYVETKI